MTTQTTEERADLFARRVYAARQAGWSDILVKALERQAVDTIRFGADECHDAFAYVLAGGVKSEYDSKLYYLDVGASNGVNSTLYGHRGWTGAIVEPDPSLKPQFDAIQRERVTRPFFVLGPTGQGENFRGSMELPCRRLTELFVESGAPKRVDVLRLSLGRRSVFGTFAEHDFSCGWVFRVLVVRRDLRTDVQRPPLIELLDQNGYVLATDGVLEDHDIFIPKTDPNCRLIQGLD